MTYLLDSVIMIDHFNGIDQATDFISHNAEQISLSVITRAEVLTGFSTGRQTLPKQVLNAFRTLGISLVEADLAADLRREYKWKLPDALQAAIALSHELLFVTRNTKDFSSNLYDFVVVPYEI